MREKQRAHYDLDEIKELARRGEVSLTRRVEGHVCAQGWDSRIPLRCIAELSESDLHKSQQHRTQPSQWLDIYRPRFLGMRMYLKYTVSPSGRVMILSFCRDGEAH